MINTVYISHIKIIMRTCMLTVYYTYRHVGKFIKNDWTTGYISHIEIIMRACMLTVFDIYRHVGKF